MKTPYSPLAALAALMAVALPSWGTTLVLPTDEQLIGKSPLIVTARVLASRAVDVDGGIWTETHLAVTETLRGAAPDVLTVREPGGTLGNRTTVIFGSAEYAPGETVLAFLTETPRGDHQTVDLLIGKFTEHHDHQGARVWVRDLDAAGVHVLDQSLEVATIDRRVQRDAARFEVFIRDAVEGRPGLPDYFVAVTREDEVVRPHFRLIDPPTIYRWFDFEEGRSVSWKSLGAQTGYSDGGTKELKDGIGSWSGYAKALIRYSYAGAGTGEPGGLTTSNGVNEVLFGDPKQEIPGSWNGNGVVGTGGFNLVNGPRNWTSTFGADAAHPQGSFQAFGITEGNLVIQNGVAPNRGITSSGLAEILAHELGHTLGFGHSADASALMYATLESNGPELRSDDELAARWLYPGSSTPPPPPTPPIAPTDLRVTTLTPELVQIRWKDNSVDETAQTIWFEPSGESLRRFGDIPANVTSANLTGLTEGRSYRFYVTAKNAAGESQLSNQIEVVIPLAQLLAAFTIAPPDGMAGITTFSFYDSSKGGVTSREWTFGDGSGSTATNPSHLYQQPGEFEVKLTVRNVAGHESTAIRTLTVGAAPLFESDFSWSPSAPLPGQTVEFTDQSAGSPTSWEWSFGDGTGSSDRHPKKAFPIGEWNVRLAISNGLQHSVIERKVVVTSGSGGGAALSAEFEMSNGRPRIGEAVEFTDRTSGEPDGWDWDFGDGGTSSSRSPSHHYSAAGTYTIVLTASRGEEQSLRIRSLIVREASHPFRSVVPASAQTAGEGGTDWRTELTIHNAGPLAADVSLSYLPDPGLERRTHVLTIPAGATQTWSRALPELFDLSVGRGAIAIDAVTDDETPSLKISSRTYTASSAGTFGQFVPSVPEAGAGPLLWLTGLDSNRSFRTNIGWTNPGPAAVRGTFRLSDSAGADLGSREMELPPFSFGQSSISALFPFLESQEKSGLTLSLASEGGRILGYASVIDRLSHDPIFLPATAVPAGGLLIVPAVGRTAGAAGTDWRSEVHAFNPTTNAMTLRMRFLGAGKDNRLAPAKMLDLAPRRGARIDDVMEWLGIETGTGALEISWSAGNGGPVVSSRTYTKQPGGGTFGQSIDPVPTTRLRLESVVTGLRSDSEYRTNIGLVNGSEQELDVVVTAVDEEGEHLAESFVSLAPLSQIQLALAKLFPSLADPETLGTFTLIARAVDRVALIAYGSVVDRKSGDPIYIAGE